MAKEYPKIQKERSQFTQLVAANPNYFGNFKASGFDEVTSIAGNTTYEELTCVGYHPVKKRLEATVQIKRASGYSGDLCDDGSTQYVRFYLDYGSGWQDAGLSSFEAFDLPDGKDCAKDPTKPLCYAVCQEIVPKRKFCGTPVTPRVRAILSWQIAPPANLPNWTPVWGNVYQTHIQIEPRKWKVIDFIDSVGLADQLKIPSYLEAIKNEPIPLPEPPPPTLAQLAQTYGAGTGAGTLAKAAQPVEPHRFGFKDVALAVDKGALDQEALTLKVQEWKNLGLDFSSAVNELAAVSGNTSYEELECLGLDLNNDHLVAVVHVKKPNGFSGSLCEPGSKEYVAFWADWDDTCSWSYLGTAEVRVHDIQPLPGGGLRYALYLPVNLLPHRSPCEKPKIGRVRAVLSWNSPPSTKNPNAVPYWGNRLDCHVQLPAGEPVLVDPNDVKPLFHRIGGIRDDDIHNAIGLTLPTAKFFNGAKADFLERACPFGGVVVITGPPFVGQNYRVQVKKMGDVVWTSLVDGIEIQPLNGPEYTKQPVGASDYFAYGSLGQNPDLILARWNTSGDAVWDIKLDIQGSAAPAVRQRIRLKNSGIEAADIEITSGAGNCGKFKVGDTIKGTFVARDSFLRNWGLDLDPFNAPAGSLKTGPPPLANTDQTPSSGEDWELDTGGLGSCGYVIRIGVWDRAILNSVPHHHHGGDSEGFCLLDP